MKIQTLAAYYNIIVGISILGIWILLFVTDQVPEIDTEPYSIIYHLIAEGLTAVFLIVAGSYIILDKTKAKQYYYISSGMLLYTVINSAGYYAEQGEFSFVLMFSVLTFLTSIFLIYNLKETT